MKFTNLILFILILGFTFGCESSKKQLPEIVSGKRKLIHEPLNTKAKSYLPLTVVWDTEENIHFGKETLIQLNITSGDVSEDVVANFAIPDELELTRGQKDVSLGNFAAGETKQAQIVISPKVPGNFHLAVNLSRVSLGQRMGFAKSILITTVEQPTQYSKPERTVDGQNGDSYYILPEGQTEVIPGK